MKQATVEAPAVKYYEALRDFQLSPSTLVRKGEHVRTSRTFPAEYFKPYRKPLRSADSPPRLVLSSQHSAEKGVIHIW